MRFLEDRSQSNFKLGSDLIMMIFFAANRLHYDRQNESG